MTGDLTPDTFGRIPYQQQEPTTVLISAMNAVRIGAAMAADPSVPPAHRARADGIAKQEKARLHRLLMAGAGPVMSGQPMTELNPNGDQRP